MRRALPICSPPLRICTTQSRGRASPWGNPGGAADAYLLATQLIPSRNDYRTRAGLSLCRVNRYGEGLTLLHEARRRSQHPAERDRLEKAIKDARESAHRIARETLAKGEIEQEKGKMRAAATLYEQALEMNPTSIEAFIRAGWIRGEHFGNYVRANEYFTRAEKLLEQAGVARSEGVWRRITGYREMLVKQKAAEDAEEVRLLEEQRLRFEAQKKKGAGGG